ncbi:MAG: DNA polymerase III subunit beta, partial [Bdellovibrionales bacterium RIFOXYB2_FULL_36_6]
MHLNVHAHELKSVISRISTIVDKKNTRPILSCILLVAKNNHLQLSCTDQEVAAQIFISAEIFEEGSFCVNAKNLSDVLRDFPDSIISISFNDQENILKIQNENINFSLVGFNDTQFPLLFFGDKQPSFEIPAYELLRIINKTSYAISIDETRPYLNGIYLQQIDSKLRSVATDGYRLSLLDIEDFNSNITEYMSNGII